MNFEKLITATEANQKFSETLRAVDSFETILITKLGRPAYILMTYEAYLRERNDKKMNKIELIERASQDGVWTLGRNLAYERLSKQMPTDDDENIIFKALRLKIRENTVEMIHVGPSTPLLMEYEKSQVEITENEEGKVEIKIAGKPTKRVFRDDDETENEYNKRFEKEGYMNRSEIELYKTAEAKYNLPEVILK